MLQPEAYQTMFEITDSKLRAFKLLHSMDKAQEVLALVKKLVLKMEKAAGGAFNPADGSGSDGVGEYWNIWSHRFQIQCI